MAQHSTRRAWCISALLWRHPRYRRILSLSGLRALPDLAFWPKSKGDVIAGYDTQLKDQSTDTVHWHISDAPLGHIAPLGLRRSDGPMGLLIDPDGAAHYDPDHPSRLEGLLKTHPLDDTALLDRARAAMARLREGHISQYNLHDPDLAPPPAGYVLVLDEAKGAVSVRASGLGEGMFKELLFRAQDDHPATPILICPPLCGGQGHLGAKDCRAGIGLADPALSPHHLLEGAVAVYTVSSQLGFEAIMAGHKPHVFGRPFYAGWGLSHDHGGPLPRRHRNLTRAQMFAAAMLLAPTWYDAARDRLCSFEDMLTQLEAELRAYRLDKYGYDATGIRLWKRGPLQAMFGREKPLRFTPPRVDRPATPALVWGMAPAPETSAKVWRIEDGFLRSRGLGADLVPPLSLAMDDLGIYYDPSQPSRLEALIKTPLSPPQEARALRLRDQILARGVTKYNLPPKPLPPLPKGLRLLVPGQVADDASLTLGADKVRDNLSLLRQARAANPAALLLWKPHPDVEAGLRQGDVAPQDLADLGAISLTGINAAQALSLADEVWTITSGLGFEALLRGLPVTTLGAPFYAGWGLTTDLGTVPIHRRGKASLAQLIHASLIAYPRYHDPISNRPCPPEVVLERLAEGRVLPRSLFLRGLARLQGAAAGYAHLWRRAPK